MCEPIDDLPKDRFIEVMAECVDQSIDMMRGLLDDILRLSGLQFGEPGHDWCAGVAREFAFECMDE